MRPLAHLAPSKTSSDGSPDSRFPQASVRLLAWRARAPRAAFIVACAVLVAAGLRAIFVQSPAPSGSTQRRTSTTDQRAVEAFAQAFARAYLSRDATRPERQRRALTALAPSALVQDDGLPSGSRDRRIVTWTAIAGDRPDGSRRAVTVAVGTTSGLTYLELQIARNRDGRIRLADYPAIVGGPPVDRTHELPSGDAVDDPALVGTARRALANYLAGRRDALAADLAPGSFVSLPDPPLALRSVESVTWSQPHRQVAVLIHAALDDGTNLTLRYRLDVIHRAGRWFVQAVGDQRPHTEVSR